MVPSACCFSLARKPSDCLLPIMLLAAGHLLSGSKLPSRELSGCYMFTEESGPSDPQPPPPSVLS